jgi:hypothetical protein
MLQIVDSYFESNGDPSRLKCSFLEVYAASLGIDAKAYDFRRNAAVRQRMEKLRGSAETNAIGAVAYKNLDVDAMLNRNHTREMMRNSLLELDETWRRIYEKAADLSRKNAALLSETLARKQIIEMLTAERETAESRVKSLESQSNALVLENRYLKKALREYLYPAIANEILRDENVLEQVDTDVSATAMAALADPGLPSPFSNAVASDMRMISREEALLKRIKEQIHGG